jgi:hypothetical protein
VDKCAQSIGVCCPNHKGLDRIRRVPVVYAEAAPDPLSPLPVLKSADRLAWAGTICGAIGAILLWIGSAYRGDISGPTLAAASVCFAYALACYGRAASRRASVVRVRRGMPRALAVWDAGWYCARCDGVFFTAAALPAGANAGELMSAEEFQHLVWAAGGFGQRARLPRQRPGDLGDALAPGGDLPSGKV